MIEHQTAWRPAGELGKWTIGNPAVVMIGGNLFVHGGISAAYAAMSRWMRSTGALPPRSRRAKSGRNRSSTIRWAAVVPRAPDPREGRRRRAGRVDDGPCGDGAAPAPRPSIEAEIDMVLKAYGARRIVIGHTPTLSGISVLHGGRLIRIDTGISQYYGGTLSWLEIAGDQVTPRHGQTVSEQGARNDANR